jgi:hypothetical protein
MAAAAAVVGRRTLDLRQFVERPDDDEMRCLVGLLAAGLSLFFVHANISSE